LINIDWSKAPRGRASGSVRIAGPAGQEVTVDVRVLNPQEPSRASLTGFVESDGYVSIESAHYTAKIDTDVARWEEIEDYGRTLSSMTVFPVTSPSRMPPASPCLQYRIYLFDPKQVQVEAILAPSLNFVPGRGLRYGVSFDDQAPQIIDALAHNSAQDWSTAVEDSVRKTVSVHSVAGSGYHVLKFWMVDPGVVLQKLVVDLGGVRPSYLGPPESFFHFR
jgi:hypothetical protein